MDMYVLAALLILRLCKENQFHAQLILSIFRQPLHVLGISRPIIRRYIRMYTTGNYYSQKRIVPIDIFINCNWDVTRWQYTFTHKQYIEQHKYELMWKSAGRAPSREFYPGICLTTEGKARKNLSQGKKNLSQVKKNLSQSPVYI
jgi:hypothetical protein